MTFPVRCVALAVALTLSATKADGQSTTGDALAGLRLGQALAELQRQGVPVIFSDELVRPDMRVGVEPAGATSRIRLNHLLRPHGLMVRNGPGGTLLVVRHPRARARLPVVPRPAAGPPPLSVPPPDAVDALRFAMTVDVADRDGSATASPAAPLVVRPLEVAALAGGFDNVFRAVQALPGVVATEEIGSRIAVRGGGPDQNLTLHDGVEIYYPFRLVMTTDDLATVALASTFNADTVGRIELYPGAFDVRYGDRLSSLLSVEHRDGTETEVARGVVSAGLTDANAVVEGRLPKSLAGSWLVSARRGFVDLLPEKVLGTTLPTFYDVHARGLWRPRATERATVFGGASRERSRRVETPSRDTGQSGQATSSVAALAYDAAIGARVTSRTLLSHSTVTSALSAFERSLDNNRGANTTDSIASGGLLSYQASRDAAVREVSLRQDLGFAPSPRHTFDAGTEVRWLQTDWGWQIAGDRSLLEANPSSIRLGQSLPARFDSSIASRRVGVWVQDRWQATSRLTLQPGLRVDYGSFTGQTTWSPRVSGTMALGSAWRVDAAVRLHTQTPGYEKMLLSDYFLDLEHAAGRLRAERAWHVVGGAQRLLRGGVTLRLDAYYRRFRDLVVGRLETTAEQDARLAALDVPSALWPSVSTGPLITVHPTNDGRGDARGLELLVSRTGGRGSPLSGWASYAVARSRRTAYGETMPFDHDRRHMASVVGTVRIGSRLDLTATGRWASGRPRTAVRGVRLSLTPDVTDADGDGNRVELVPLRDAAGQPLFQPDLGSLADINRARQPNFARLDARLTYRPSWGGERWTFHLDLLNVLNASNVAAIDSVLVLDPGGDRPRIVEVPGDRGIPFLPSLGVRFSF